MKIIYLGTIPTIHVPKIGKVERGKEITVSESLGKRLIKQNPKAWQGSFRDRLVTKKKKSGGKG